MLAGRLPQELTPRVAEGMSSLLGVQYDSNAEPLFKPLALTSSGSQKCLGCPTKYLSWVSLSQNTPPTPLGVT